MPNSKRLKFDTRRSPPRKILALIVCLLLAGCSDLKHNEEGALESPISQGPPPTVVVTTAVQKTIPIYNEFVARTEASQTVEIRSRVEGMLEHYSFQQGDFVSKGQILFTIDKQSFEAALESALAELEKAETEVLHAKQQVDLKQEQSELAKFESALVLAKQDLNRVVPLVKEGALEKRQLDITIDAEKRALAAVDSQRAKVSNTALNQNVQIRQAAAHVSAAKASVKQAQLSLGYTTIRSPLRGIIGRVHVHPGNLVGRGENTLLATISAVDPIKVNFSISEATYLQWMKSTNGSSDVAPLELILADGSTHPYKGIFKMLDRAVNPHTGTISLQAAFPNPKSILRPGQFARARVMVELRKNAILIPQRCVQETQGLKSVLVVGPDNKVSLRTINLGPRYENFVVVSSGLKAGERVILEGLQKARPGEVVTMSSRAS